MQQLEIAGNLCHSVLSSSCENRAFLEPVSQSSLRLVRDAPVYSAWLAASHQHDGVSSNSSTWQPPISFSLTAMLLAFCKRTGSVCCHKLSQWLMSSSTLPRPSQCLCHGTALQLLSSKRLLGFTLVSPSSTQVCLSAGGVFHAYNPLWTWAKQNRSNIGLFWDWCLYMELFRKSYGTLSLHPTLIRKTCKHRETLELCQFCRLRQLVACNNVPCSSHWHFSWLLLIRDERENPKGWFIQLIKIQGSESSKAWKACSYLWNMLSLSWC